jgi:prepilin-type N-terminal cleavage/methylation domain-containing protein
MRSWKAFRSGFTLIELLLVIAIIGVLTALVVSGMSPANVKARIAMALAERGQMELAIQEYKDKLGFYPPDNPNNPVINPLWFELLGTTNNGNTYVTLDGSGQISTSEMNTNFGRQGFLNSGTKARATDESGAPMSFLNSLQDRQVRPFDAKQPLVKILVCSEELPSASASAPIPGTRINPWRYVSSHPTNNPGSYDLWVDVVVGGKTYRIGNWSREPIIIP